MASSCAAFAESASYGVSRALLHMVQHNVLQEAKLDLAATDVVAPDAIMPDSWFSKKATFICVGALFIMGIISLGVLTAFPKSATADALAGSEKYRPDVDGLRAVAVTSVLVFHLNKAWLPGGWAGVDIFFVISGYVVTGSLVRRKALCSMDGMRSFYAARAKRLMPNSMCTIFTTGLLLCLFLPKWSLGKKDPQSKMYNSGLYATFASTNILFGSLRQDYWATGADSPGMNPFTHMWSLAVEEQFYMLYPLLLLILHGEGLTMQSLQASPRRSRTVLFICVALSFIAYLYTRQSNKEAAFYYLQFRFWELAIGGWLYEFQASSGESWSDIMSSKLLQIVLQLLVMILIPAALFLPVLEESDRTVPMSMAVIGTVCCIAANSDLNSNLRRILSMPFLVYIGNVSYSLYLWHWPIFTIFRWTVGLKSALCAASAVLLTISLALAAYSCIEKPLRHRTMPDWQVWVAVLAGIFFCQMWLLAVSHSRFTLVPVSCPAEYTMPVKKALAMLHIRNQTSNPCACMLRNATYHTPASAITAESGKKGLPDCFPDANAGSRMSEEHLTSDRQLLVIGDSHAFHAFAAFNSLRPVRELYNVTLFNKVCVGFTGHDEFCFEPGEAKEYREEVFQKVREMKRNDIVVFSHSIFKPPDVDVMRELSVVLEERNVSLILFGDNPYLRHDMTKCVPTWIAPDASKSCATSVSQQRSMQQELETSLRNLSKTLPSTYYFKRWHLYCDDKMCDSFIPGTCTIAFKDREHMEEIASSYSSPFLCEFMNSHKLL